MYLKLIPVTSLNRNKSKDISVFEHQKGHIETVEECLEEADIIKGWRPVYIYDGENLIGFAMYGYICEREYLDLWSKFIKDDDEENPYINIEDYTWDRSRVWLDRFMIDKNHQGKGYARPVLRFLIDNIKKEYPNEDIYLNVYDDNPVAIKLYKEFGFEFTEELDVNGEKVMSLNNK